MKNVAKTGKFPRVRSREEQLVIHKEVSMTYIAPSTPTSYKYSHVLHVLVDVVHVGYIQGLLSPRYDEFEAQHKTLASNVTDHRVYLLQLHQLFDEVLAGIFAVLL